MKRKPEGALMLRTPYGKRPVLAEDFSTLQRTQDLTRIRAVSPNRPVKLIH